MPRRATNDETQTAARRERVAALYLRGLSQQAIAAAVKASQPTVSRDLDAVRAEWRAAAALDFGARVAEELARIDRMEREAWEAWERSRTPAETTAAGKTRAADGPRSKASKRVEGRDGDPRFLQVVGWCVTRRCELLGLDAPTRFSGRTVLAGDPNAPLKHDVNTEDLRDLTDAELDDRLSAARRRVDASAEEGGPGPGTPR